MKIGHKLMHVTSGIPYVSVSESFQRNGATFISVRRLRNGAMFGPSKTVELTEAKDIK